MPIGEITGIERMMKSAVSRPSKVAFFEQESIGELDSEELRQDVYLVLGLTGRLGFLPAELEPLNNATLRTVFCSQGTMEVLETEIGNERRNVSHSDAPSRLRPLIPRASRSNTR